MAFLLSLWHSGQSTGLGAGYSSATGQPCDLENILLSGALPFSSVWGAGWEGEKEAKSSLRFSFSLKVLVVKLSLM